MTEAEPTLDRADLSVFLSRLGFIREFAIDVVSFAPGAVTVELPFSERFSGPAGFFPASMVGTAGDVAAVSSCLSMLPKGWALATLDFTVKMTGPAKGDRLLARGRVLQNGRTNSVGASDVYAVSGGAETLCGTVLATTRNFKIKD